MTDLPDVGGCALDALPWTHELVDVGGGPEWWVRDATRRPVLVACGSDDEEAVAQLASAAPELLSAAEEALLLLMVHAPPSADETLDALRAAIGKAKEGA